MNADQYTRPVEPVQTRRLDKHERQVAAIVVGLAVVATGNSLAVIRVGDIDTNNVSTTDSQSSGVRRDQPEANLQSPSTYLSAPAVSTRLVSRPYPMRNFLLEPDVTASPATEPSPVVTVKPAEPQPTLHLPKHSPDAALKQKTTGFTAAEIRPMSDLTKNTFDNMVLTVEQYQSFLATIDTTHLEFAHQFTPFNPNEVNIEQRRSEFFTLHFTAFYSNFGESSKTEPVGDMDVRKLITTMGSRGKVCCGINWILDRDGKVFQTAPVEAKLRHNPPYDSITTGVEVEASEQNAISSKQYEALTYLAIAVLKQQGLLDKELSRVIHGHGEDRDKLRQADPETKWESRNDFDASTSDYFRSKVALFLQDNPALKDIYVSLG